MAPFAIQGAENKVVDIDLLGFVQRLLLFDHCIIPTIWLEDVQILLKRVNADDLAALLESGALSFYVDSATAAEMGQARADLNLTGNVKRLQDNEFNFVTIRGHDEEAKVRRAIHGLTHAENIQPVTARRIADLVEQNMLTPRGLEISAEAFKGFYSDLRTQDTPLVEKLIANRLTTLGIRAKGLDVSTTEIESEDFQVNSNLIQKFGLSSKKAREIVTRALLDLVSVHDRLAHMRNISCLIGMNPQGEIPWQIKADVLIQKIEQEQARDRQFSRVIAIAGIGESNLIENGHINLRKLMELRESEDILLLRAWLKETDNKTDAEIKDRVRSVRGRIGNRVQGRTGKVIRLMLSAFTGLIPDPATSIGAGLAFGATDSFLVEKLFPKDTIQNIIGNEYPSILGRGF